MFSCNSCISGCVWWYRVSLLSTDGEMKTHITQLWHTIQFLPHRHFYHCIKQMCRYLYPCRDTQPTSQVSKRPTRMSHIMRADGAVHTVGSTHTETHSELDWTARTAKNNHKMFFQSSVSHCRDKAVHEAEIMVLFNYNCRSRRTNFRQSSLMKALQYIQ